MISKYITHKLRKWWELDSMNILKIETVECLSLCSTTKCQNCLGVSKQQLKLMNIQDICKYMKVNSATIYFRICHNIVILFHSRLNHAAELTNLLSLKYRMNSFQSSPPALPAYIISPMPRANTTCRMI